MDVTVAELATAPAGTSVVLHGATNATRLLPDSDGRYWTVHVVPEPQSPTSVPWFRRGARLDRWGARGLLRLQGR